MSQNIEPRPFEVFTRTKLDQLPQFRKLPRDQRRAITAVSAVLPFRVNRYVVDDLIDWSRVPDDPMFQLTFPQEGMLEPDDFERMLGLVRRGAPSAEVKHAAREIQMKLNPHPAGQMELNVPSLDGEPLRGMQHKYKQTVLFFPASGQTCHSYCTYCFRWAQFVGIDGLKFHEREASRLVDYLRQHPEVTDVLFTGGDPLVMTTKVLRRYIEPMLGPELAHVRSIRIGTKAPAYWPYRFVTQDDSGDLMRLFEQVVDAGKHLALMAHISHPVELSTPVAEEAIRRITGTGAVVRCQAPLIRGVNDDPDVWSSMWQRQVELGAVPYYMFVERDTGAAGYFGVPLARAHRIFSTAFRQVSGLARTVRGPSMSATPGKVMVDGLLEIDGARYFALKVLQGRNPDWANRMFLAEYDEEACWLDDLTPAFGEEEFFFEPWLRAMAERRHKHARSTGLPHVRAAEAS